MTIYRGRREPTGVHVSVDGAPLDPRYDLKHLSSAGFEWGYNGAGPMQLALAILANHYGDERRALADYRRYCELVLAEIDADDWTIDGGRIDGTLADVTDVPMTLEQLLGKVRGDR